MQYPTQKTVTAFHDKTQLVRQKRKIVLRVRVPEKPDRLVELVRTRVSLGRSRNNHVVIEHDSVSAAHAELQQIDQRIEFVDLDSRNGSWVNNRWVSRAEVVVGDELRLGDERIDLLSFDEVDIPLSSEHRLGDLWGGSDVMRELFVELASFAAADINLLIQGETGTGKELAARAVHAFSPRADGPFVVVDCGQLVPALASSALFGHARGAFTGADRATPGAFEVAHGGTIFLTNSQRTYVDRHRTPTSLAVLGTGVSLLAAGLVLVLVDQFGCKPRYHGCRTRRPAAPTEPAFAFHF